MLMDPTYCVTVYIPYHQNARLMRSPNPVFYVFTDGACPVHFC